MFLFKIFIYFLNVVFFFQRSFILYKNAMRGNNKIIFRKQEVCTFPSYFKLVQKEFSYQKTYMIIFSVLIFVIK